MFSKNHNTGLSSLSSLMSFKRVKQQWLHLFHTAEITLLLKIHVPQSSFPLVFIW
jgi:hypothetical protein